MRVFAGGMNGIGDELTYTALVREHKRARPSEEIHIFNSNRPWIWENNPHVGHGTTNNGKEIRPNNYGFPKGNTAHGYAKQAGFELVDDTPELWLTQQELDQDFGVPSFEKSVAIDVGAMWPSRVWGADRFVRVAELLRDDGWTVIEVGHREEPLSERIPCDYSFLNKLKPRENCALLSKVSLYLGNDSGSFHMAASVNTPQVAIFGPINWYARSYWNTTPVFAYSECAPACMENCVRKLGDPKERGHVYKPTSRCIDEIQPERVAEAARVAYNRFVAPGLRISRPRPGRSRPLAPVGSPPVDW